MKNIRKKIAILTILMLSAAFNCEAGKLYKGAYYFDNKNFALEHVTFLVQDNASGYTHAYPMELVADTDLWRVEIDPEWDSFAKLAFIGLHVKEGVYKMSITKLVDGFRNLPVPPTEDDGEEQLAEPEKITFSVFEIAVHLPMHDDNVFVPFVKNDPADQDGIWMPLHPEQFAPSGTLPILYVNTSEPYIQSKSNYIDAEMRIDAGASGEFASVGSADEPLTLKIRGRGNSTWNYSKRPYRLKLDSKTALLGMPKSKHWALLAVNSGVCDWVSCYAGLNMCQKWEYGWHPHLQPVELVLNGNYEGMYFLIETIKIDKNRLDIYEQKDLEEDEELITGGWLVEIDNYYDECQIVLEEGEWPLRVTYHSPEVLSPAQEQWLTDEINAITESIYSLDFEANGWEEYLDIESMVKYFLINEVLDDADAYNGSLYLHKDLGEGCKWNFGPAWDMSCMLREKTDFTVVQRAYWTVHPHWICELIKYPRFWDYARGVWGDFYKNLLPEAMADNLALANKVEAAMAANARRWPAISATSTAYSRAEMLNGYLRDNAKWIDDRIYTYTGIDDVLAPSYDVALSLSNGIIEASPNATAIAVYDLAGRKLASARGAKVATDYKGIALVAVDMPQGKVVKKIALK